MRNDARLAGFGIVLDPIAVEHVDDRYVNWLNDPLVRANTEIGAGPHTLVTTRAYVAASIAAPDAMMWRILDGDGLHVGNLRLSAINTVHRRAAVALIVGERSRWGNGIASRAIELATRLAFDHLGLHKLWAGIYATNPASRRAFEKAGFRLESTLREHAFQHDRFIDIWQMARFAQPSAASS